MSSFATIRDQFPRVGGINTLDLGGTAAAAYLIAWAIDKPYWKVLIVTLITGEVVHYALGINTAVVQPIDVWGGDIGVPQVRFSDHPRTGLDLTDVV